MSGNKSNQRFGPAWELFTKIFRDAWAETKKNAATESDEYSGLRRKFFDKRSFASVSNFQSARKRMENSPVIGFAQLIFGGIAAFTYDLIAKPVEAGTALLTFLGAYLLFPLKQLATTAVKAVTYGPSLLIRGIAEAALQTDQRLTVKGSFEEKTYKYSALLATARAVRQNFEKGNPLKTILSMALFVFSIPADIIAFAGYVATGAVDTAYKAAEAVAKLPAYISTGIEEYGARKKPTLKSAHNNIETTQDKSLPDVPDVDFHIQGPKYSPKATAHPLLSTAIKCPVIKEIPGVKKAAATQLGIRS